MANPLTTDTDAYTIEKSNRVNTVKTIAQSKYETELSSKGFDEGTKKMFDSKNISCLSSPYLNKAPESYKPTNQIHEHTKLKLRNQMLDLELLKLPSIGPEELSSKGSNPKITNLGT